MTNIIAFWLALLIALALGVDWFYQGWEGIFFLGHKLNELIEWLAFWR